MKYKIFTIFILFFILTTKSFALVSVDITRGNLDPLPTAISDFYLDSKLDDKIKNLKLESKLKDAEESLSKNMNEAQYNELLSLKDQIVASKKL